MNALEKRLRRLEATAIPEAATTPVCLFFYTDGDDPEPARLKAEAECRAEHGLPEGTELMAIGVHGVSTEWAKSQESAEA